MAQLLQPKQQLAGYEIIELVGKGGMGEVYRARQMSMDRIVALKVLAPRLAKQDPSFATRFVDEARAAGRLNNPNIIAVHDVGKEPIPGDPDGLEYDYFSMEFVDGESVKDFIERQGSLPMSLVVQVMNGMSEALVYAESQGIVHRDIKPDNIMITSDGTVKLADLGLALQLGNEEGVANENDGPGRGKVMGTPLYMSPEQARALPVDHRSDQYSLGATLFHMLTGQPPFAGESAKAIMKAHVFEPVPDPKLHREVPEAWRALCMKLMAKNPDDRFPSCAALRTAVQAAIEGPAMPGATRRLVRAGAHAPAMPGWARMLIYGFAAAVVAMVVVNLDWSAFQRPKDGPPPPVVVPPPGADEALDRVKTVLKSLPPEPDQALAILQKCAADRSLQTDAAHRLLDAEIAKLRRAVEERQRQQREQEQARQRLAKLDEVKKAIEGGDLNQAKAGLQALAAEADRLPAPAKERLKQLPGQFQAALEEARKKAMDRIAKAARREEVEAALNEAKGLPFPEAVMTALAEEAGKRQAALAKAATPTPAPAADDKALWQALNENLEPLRGGFNYGEITSLAEREAPRFANPQSREQVLALAELGRLATTAESALRGYLRESNPMIELQFRNKPTKAKLLNLDKDYLTIQLMDGVETKLNRKEVALPLRELVDKALADSPIEPADRPRILAAMLWVWRAPEAKAAFAKLGDDPLARAVAGLESRARVLDLRAPVVKKGKEVVVTYDFTSKNQALLGDFLGTGTAFSEHGMAWTTTDTIKGGSGPEATLPILCWKESLSPPLTVSCQLWLRPLTQLALIGVMGGDQRIRAGFKNDKPMAHAVAALVTDENGNFKAEEGTLRNASFKTTEPVRIEIAVDADYLVEIKYDDNLLLEGAQLPVGKPVTLIIQALQTKGQTTIEVGNLKITGSVPER